MRLPANIKLGAPIQYAFQHLVHSLGIIAALTISDLHRGVKYVCVAVYKIIYYHYLTGKGGKVEENIFGYGTTPIGFTAV